MKRCKNPQCRKELLSDWRKNKQEYCEECSKEKHDEQRRRIAKRFRKNHSIRPSYFKQEINWDIEDYCSNCGQETYENVDYDTFHGEVICRKCGLIVGTIQL